MYNVRVLLIMYDLTRNNVPLLFILLLLVSLPAIFLLHTVCSYVTEIWELYMRQKNWGGAWE